MGSCCPGLETAPAALLPEVQAVAIEAKLVPIACVSLQLALALLFFVVSWLLHSLALTASSSGTSQ